MAELHNRCKMVVKCCYLIPSIIHYDNDSSCFVTVVNQNDGKYNRLYILNIINT